MTKVTLNTNTNLLRNGSNLGVYTFYTPYDRNIEAFISGTVQNLNGVNFIEGEGGYTNFNFENTIFFVNELGELLVTSQDADKFSLDPLTGQLQITE